MNHAQIIAQAEADTRRVFAETPPGFEPHENLRDGRAFLGMMGLTVLLDALILVALAHLIGWL